MVSIVDDINKVAPVIPPGTAGDPE